nr:delta-lactam-biosynthetic de-N-acetylase [uncultured Agathobaculum sp.]
MFITITRDTLCRVAAGAGVCALLAALFFLLPQSGPSAAQTAAGAEAASASITDWGLSFQTNGQPPVGNASSEELAQYGAYYLGDTGKKTIYLTFDAGYENGYTPAILDTLKKHNAPACFFVVGNYIDTAPELVQRMVDEGHIVGNHTLHHPDMSTIADQESFSAELTGLEEKFTELTGQPMQKFYRPPQGKFSVENLKQAQELGYTTVFWSLAYVDWYTDNQPTDEQAFSKLVPRIHNGAIVLLHSTSETNARILDELLTRWEEEGYTFGSLAELAG